SNPQQLLLAYQQLIQILQTKSAGMPGNRSQFLMDSISPILNRLTDTLIPMPGANAFSTQQCITVEKVHKTCQILHTKTKPKRIAFYGSNGRLYTFLFKGQEDLHLDERIMQLLSITNKIFS